MRPWLTIGGPLEGRLIDVDSIKPGQLFVGIPVQGKKGWDTVYYCVRYSEHLLEFIPDERL